ncbi:MAG: hypothetical protein ACOYXM_10880 [Actinomycetota bacterium]
MAEATVDIEALRRHLSRLRPQAHAAPDVSVAIPVNAREDLGAALEVVAQVCGYSGDRTVEVVLAVNNYEPEAAPAEIEQYRALGLTVAAHPSVFRSGEAVCLSARMTGIRAAAAEAVVSFDADCRIRDVTRLLDWYVEQLTDPATGAAYGRVDYYDLRPLWSVRARIAAHHVSRWVKRVLLRIPTTRGSNYGVRRTAVLALYDQGMLGDDLNVGPTVKAAGHRVVYTGSRTLAVETSGRRFTGGWRKLARYLRYRLRYNRDMLPVLTNEERQRRHGHHDRNLRG